MATPPSPTVTTRAAFETLIESRLREAKLLLDAGEWDGAYYLTGYAVEYAFKVRIIALMLAAGGFPARKTTTEFYQHNLMVLRQAAQLAAEMDADPAVAPAWTVAKDWNEEHRYLVGKSEAEARTLYDAVTNKVLPWIRSRW